MTGTDLCVNLATSVPVIFEPPCILPTAILDFISSPKKNSLNLSRHLNI